MLVGRPIDGPSQPVPSEETVDEPQPDRHFYRPEPRNVYTPTPEQIEFLYYFTGRVLFRSIENPGKTLKEIIDMT